MGQLSLETFAGTCVSAAVLCYSHIGAPLFEWPQEPTAFQAQASEYFSWDYYEIIDQDFSREVEQFQTLQSFAANVLVQIQDLEPDFAKTVDEHFWDLV